MVLMIYNKKGSTLMSECEFYDWVQRIQNLCSDRSNTAVDEVTSDLVAAFRVFDRDKNGYITKVSFVNYTRTSA